MKNDDFGDRMKRYESVNSIKIDHKLPFVVRLDGRKFSSLLRDSIQPFDADFSDAMINVCVDLCKEFHPDLIYTQSDEITMVFFQDRNTKGHIPEPIFSGKVQKITSIFASLTSVSFTKHFNKCSNKRLVSFDARVFNVPSIIEAYNAVLWRQKDCHRNCIQKLGQHYIGKKKIKGIKTKELLEMVRKEYDSLQRQYKFGVFINSHRVGSPVNGMISMLPYESVEDRIRFISE